MRPQVAAGTNLSGLLIVGVLYTAFIVTIFGLEPELEGCCNGHLQALVTLAVDVDFSEPVRLSQQELCSWECGALSLGNGGFC